MTDFEQIASTFKLDSGAHDNPEVGMCAMEAVAWLNGEPHSDHPKCTCHVIAAYVRVLNDSLPNNKRQELQKYLFKLIDTVSPEHEIARAEYLIWQAIKVFAPIALDVAGLHYQANKLRYFDGDLSAAAAAARAAAYAAYAARAARAAAYAAAYVAAAAADAAALDVDAAARAARAARAAARAAAYVAYAADAVNIWQHAFDALDGVLEIGKKDAPSIPTDRNLTLRVETYKELVR